MPELPEVEIVKKGLRKSILNKKVTSIKVLNVKLRKDINKEFINDIINSKIIEVRRIAKYIIIDLSNKKSILLHLGMTGKLTVEKLNKNDLKKHTHIIISLNDGNSIIYNDVRRFGLAITLNTKDIEKHKLIVNIGIEPLNKEFTGNLLYKLLQNRKSNIKTTLLNQKIVCGIGNIYACEALFYSGIKPTRIANSLKLSECDILSKTIKKILQDSINAGGSTLKDYVQSDGSKGSYQNTFAVYGKEGEPCLVCDNKIKKIKQAGRSTFYCNICQK